MRLYCYIDDRGGWGERLMIASNDGGLEAQLFRKAEEVVDEVGSMVYMHMDHLQLRERDKQVAGELSDMKNITMVPTTKECYIYDDKLLQYLELREWMPYTFYTTSKWKARFHLMMGNQKVGWPFVSKAKEGAGSSNVRFIQNKEEAKEELNQVFSAQGLPRYDPSKRGLTQKGYLLWQRFIPDNINDWRVIILGLRYGLIAKRFNRPDLPFASGSGEWVPVKELTEGMSVQEDHAGMLEHALKVCRAHGFLFAGFDLVKGIEGELYILEMTQGWAWPGLTKDCRFFQRTGSGWKPTGFTGMEQFELMAKMFKKGEFNGLV